MEDAGVALPWPRFPGLAAGLEEEALLEGQVRGDEQDGQDAHEGKPAGKAPSCLTCSSRGGDERRPLASPIPALRDAVRRTL